MGSSPLRLGSRSPYPYAADVAEETHRALLSESWSWSWLQSGFGGQAEYEYEVARGWQTTHLVAVRYRRNYSDYMAMVKLKVVRIGNSRGIRLPATSLRRYRIGDTVWMEERSEGILLRPAGPAVEKLTWEETAREMAASDEDWGDWETTAGDGVQGLPWDEGSGAVAERPTSYRRRSRARTKR